MNNLTDVVLDLQRFIGPLTEEPKPRSILEIYEELRTFPFKVRAIAPGHPMSPYRLGDSATVLGFCDRHPGFVFGNTAHYCCALGTMKRWILLGH